MDEYGNNLYGKAQTVLQDKANYIEYIQAEKAERGERARINFAKQKGREKEKIEIATRMKNKGYSIEYISEITELTQEFIEKL